MALYYSTKTNSSATDTTNKPKKNPLDSEYYVAMLELDPETGKSHYKCVVFRSKSKDACRKYADENFVKHIVTTGIKSGSELVKLGMDEKYLKSFKNPEMY